MREGATSERGGMDEPQRQDSRTAADAQQMDDAAPRYSIPAKRLIAVEHPLVVKDVDKAIKTFGRSASFKTVRATPMFKFSPFP